MPSLDRLPKQFLPYLEKIASTITQCVEINLQQTNQFLAWESHLGGFPYLPLNMEYPKSIRDNQPLQFLGQIHFEDMPFLSEFPKKGILQFYLDMQSIDLGVDESLDQIQYKHRVLYFPEIIKDVAQLQSADSLMTLSKIDEDQRELWIEPSCLKFNLLDQYITFFDYQFAPMLFERNEVTTSYNYDDIAHAYQHYEQPYTEQFQIEGGHRLGGYPNFLHSTDHRTEFRIEDHILLMQLDTDVGLEWGDSGIAHWFIHPEDLKNKNFSRVIFLWACH